MAKTKSVEEAVESYVGSVATAMLKYKKYLMKERNFSQDYAIGKTLDYGFKMLMSGLGGTMTPQKATALFREQADICISLANMCENSE